MPTGSWAGPSFASRSRSDLPRCRPLPNGSAFFGWLAREADRERGPGARAAIVALEGGAGLAEGLPGAPDMGRQREDLGPRLQRPGLEARHGQELANHPRQPVGLLGDDREAPIRVVGRELVGIGPDARER